MITVSGSALERASKRGPLGFLALACIMGIFTSGAIASLPLTLVLGIVYAIVSIYGFHIAGEVLLCKYDCKELITKTNGNGNGNH